MVRAALKRVEQGICGDLQLLFDGTSSVSCSVVSNAMVAAPIESGSPDLDLSRLVSGVERSKAASKFAGGRRRVLVERA